MFYMNENRENAFRLVFSAFEEETNLDSRFFIPSNAFKTIMRIFSLQIVKSDF